MNPWCPDTDNTDGNMFARRFSWTYSISRFSWEKGEAMDSSILLIDDESSVRMSFTGYLEDSGYQVVSAENGRKGLELFSSQEPDLVLTDLRMQDIGGMEVLAQIRRISPEKPVIVVSGMGTLADSIEALRLGAWDYLIKPVQDMRVLVHSIERALEHTKLLQENRRYHEHLEELVSERTMELEQRTKEAREASDRLRIFSMAVEQSASSVVITDTNGMIEYVNQRFTDFTGYQQSEVLGRTPSIMKSDKNPPTLYSEMWKTISSGRVWRGEMMNRKKSGDHYWEYMTITPIVTEDQGISHYLAVQEDITHRKEYEQKLFHQANHDNLTGLPNRMLAMDRLKQSIAQACRDKTKGALLYLDLDGFKKINDNFGHEVGDQVLVSVSKRLKNSLRKTDTVARIGGDEFLVVLRGLGNKQQCAALAGKIVRDFHEPFDLAGREFYSTLSIGITFFPDEGTGPDDLLKNADSAMYTSKNSGRNRYSFFSVGSS